MYILMVVVFVLGYLAIALEHTIRIDKAASALLTAVLCWTILVFGGEPILNLDYSLSIGENIASGADINKYFAEFMEHFVMRGSETTHEIVSHFFESNLLHHLGEIAAILFFLLGAMTIVELIDAHEGFRIITDRVTTENKVKLMWLLCLITFFFSAALDNLTTAIVMSALLKKLIKDKADLWMFAGMVILAANAGGAWSPIGDVTTIMLWIDGQITAANIVAKLFLPSLVCMIVPLLILTFTMKGTITRPLGMLEKENLLDPTSNRERNLVFFLGVAALLFVPVFKTVTHLPPFMGILFGLSILWLVTEIIHRSKNHEERQKLSVIGVLRKVDTPSVLFFLGILTAVASLQSAGHLVQLANFLEASVGNIYAINIIIGLLSSVVDNVPLVAGAMGMYEISEGAQVIPGVAYPVDHPFWEFLAYCAGTGGSCLIIGSAAGVAQGVPCPFSANFRGG